MLKALGPNWSFLLTDVTKGSPGNDERMAFVFDNRRIHMSGLACELVVPKEQLDNIEPNALDKQFARTPYAVSFRTDTSPIKKPRTFILITLHVLYGKNPKERVPELKAISKWISDWAKDINAFDHNLIVLGDFNIDRKDDELYEAFTSTGLQVPQDLHQVPRTIFADPDKPNLDKYYDQIAWFTKNNNLPALSMKHIKSGYFDFTQVALSTLNLTKNKISWRMSDHYPLWTEFSLEE